MRMSSKKIPELVSHIEQEKGRCAPAKQALNRDIEKWYSTYELDNKELKRNIPFQGASAAFQPLLFTQTKLLYGKIWGMQFRHRPLVSCTPTVFNPPKELVETTQEIQHSLDHIMYNEMEVRRKMMPITLEGLLCGMGVGYVPYRLEKKMLPINMPGVKKPVLLPQVTFANADIQHIPLAHCGWPPEAPSIERARWFSRDIWWSADELVEMAQAEDVDDKAVWDIIKGGGDTKSDWASKYGDMINLPSHHSPHYHMRDWWGWYRDGRSLPVMYNVLYHVGSLKPILWQENPYDDHAFPFAIWNFFPRVNKILGIGIGRLLTDMNGALNEIWNQRINAGRIANTKMFAIRKGSGVRPSDKMYPGKRFYLTNPQTDIKEIEMGDVKQSAYADETDIWNVADKAVSTTEYQRGNQTISRPNASGQLALINLAEENISIIGDNLRIFWSRAGRLIYSRHRQYSPPTKLLPSKPEGEGKMILEALGSNRITFDLAAADERINPEAERQKLSTAYQMYTGYYENLLQYAQLVASPEMPPLVKTIAAKSMQAMTQFMKRIGRNLNLQGFEEFLVTQEDISGDPTQGRPGIPSLAQGANQVPTAGQPGIPTKGTGDNARDGSVYPRLIAG
jgi:hypothetical protein